MVVINDIATLHDIHPPNKQDVGYRLALLALKNDYGKQDLVANSPEFDSLEVLGDRLKLKFKNIGGGLKTRDGEAPTRFEIIGAGSNGFQPATASIDGDAVILSAENVKTPVAFRFAWHMLAEPNLTGASGLPVGACRAGELPDFLSQLPVAKEYTLVYDFGDEKFPPMDGYARCRSITLPLARHCSRSIIGSLEMLLTSESETARARLVTGLSPAMAGVMPQSGCGS